MYGCITLHFHANAYANWSVGCLYVRASPAVESPQAEIRRYLAPDGCKFWHVEAHVSSGEPIAFFEFKVEVDEIRRSLMKFDEN
jgi:hypothetical protein